MANKGKVKLEKLEKIEIDEEKVKQAVEATLKQIIDLTKVARLAGWKIGCLVSNNTAHLNKKEKGYYFTVISQKTGLTEGYIKQCETFYHKFPTLPRLLADTGLPVGFFHWLAMKGLSQYQIEEWVKKNLALLKDKDLRELKTIAKNKFEIQGNLKYLPVCQFCQQELEWPDRKGARCAPVQMGPIPGPPPPCGIQKVLCRFR